MVRDIKLTIVLTLAFFSLLTFCLSTTDACTINTPSYTAQKDYRFDTGNRLSGYYFSVNCPSGTSFTVRHVSPSTVGLGYGFYIRWTHDTSKYLNLSFYRDSSYTQQIKLNTDPIVSGVGTGQTQEFIVYPNLRIGSGTSSGCPYNSSIQKYVCPVSTLRATITWKVVF